MGLIQAYKMAIKSILSNKVRAFLTMLGVIIGVGSVIAAVAFAQGQTANITESIKGLGTNLIQINIVGRGSNRSLSYEKLKTFKDANSDIISSVAPMISNSMTVKAGTKTRSTTINGTTPEYEEIKNTHVSSGRFLLQVDVDNRKKVCLIGTAVQKDIFEGQSGLGKTLKINGDVYKVVGIITETASSETSSDDDQIIIPITTAQRLTRTATIRNFSVLAADSTTVDEAITKLKTFLTGIYTDENMFRVNSSTAMLTTLNDVTGSMMVILGGIAAISLIVGGIGIMNIMLVSVTERTREIGIRKAIGARRSNIMVQFLIEAIMVTGIGGVLGVLTGVSIIKFIIGGLKISTPVYSPFWIVVSFGISLTVGVIFGLFPAYKAARLNPIDALRFE